MNPVKGLQNKSLGLESGQYITQQLLEGSQPPFTVNDLLYRCSPVRPVCCGTWHSSTSPREFSVAVQADVTSARLHSIYLHPEAARDVTRAWDGVWLVVCRRWKLENQKVKGHSCVHTDVEASLAYRRPCLKKDKNRNKQANKKAVTQKCGL